MKLRAEKKTISTDTLFFAPDILLTQQLPEQESAHCVKVLRLSNGDTILVTDGKGYFYECTIVEAHHKRCVLAIDKKIHKPKSWDFNISIAFAPTKSNDRTEWFAEKATEIGIDSLSPVNCRFSERKELKTERLNRVVIAAMKQSQQAVLPHVNEMESFQSFIEQPFDGNKYIAHCYQNEKQPLNKLYNKGENALILIGPEGDFSEEEIEKAIAQGFQPISLGDTRLRTETAALVACHTIHVLNM